MFCWRWACLTKWPTAPLRLSLNEDNTEAEVDAILAAVPPVGGLSEGYFAGMGSVRERRTPLCYTVKK